MPSLDDICPDRQIAKRLSDGVTASPEDMASRRFRKRTGHMKEVYSLRISAMSETELADLRTIESDAGRSGPVAWTPPGIECYARAFRIMEYRDGFDTPRQRYAEMQLLRLPGVEAPA
jgi:hypothetical protein